MCLIIYANIHSYFSDFFLNIEMDTYAGKLDLNCEVCFQNLCWQRLMVTYHIIFFIGRPNFEEGGPASVGRKHEFIRSESENWRIFREEQNGEDEDGGWRLAGSRRDGERWRPHSPGKNSE